MSTLIEDFHKNLRCVAFKLMTVEGHFGVSWTLTDCLDGRDCESTGGTLQGRDELCIVVADPGKKKLTGTAETVTGSVTTNVAVPSSFVSVTP